MQQSMFVYNTDWHGSKTFRMVPIDLNCPFNEVIYDPETKVLAVVSKEYKEKPQMFPKLNDKGAVILKQGATVLDNPNSFVEDRVFMDTYYEYYIDTLEDIKDFVDYFAMNSRHKSLRILEE